jgi:hypothetical protein
MTATITITVAPHGNNTRGKTFKVVAIEIAGAACTSGTDLDPEAFRPSTTPFLNAARRLLDHGIPEDAKLVMRHEGGDGVALSSRLGYAASKTVKESTQGKPVFANFEPQDLSLIRAGTQRDGRCGSPRKASDLRRLHDLAQHGAAGAHGQTTASLLSLNK